MAMAHHNRNSVVVTLRRFLLLFPLALILLIAGLWYWLLHTQQGANWVWSIAVSAADEALASERLSGNLSDGVTIHRLTFSNDSVNVSVSEVSAAIDVDLPSRSITIDPAKANGVVVTLIQSDASAPETRVPDLLQSLQLPVELVFPRLVVENVAVTGTSESDPFLIDAVALSGRWEDEIRIDSFDIQTTTVHARGGARVTLANPQILFVDATATIPGSGVSASLTSEFNLQSEQLSGRLDWENFHWPLDGGATQFESQTGSVLLAGTLDAWSVDGTLHVLVPEAPEGTFTVSAKGNRDTVTAEIVDGDVLGGTVTGSAEYSWRAEKRFAADVDASGIHTRTLVPDWPMTLSGSLAVQGQQQPLAVSVNATNVRGDVLGMPLLANGRFKYSETDWSFEDLHIQHGESTARVSGNPYSASGVNFDVDVDDIQHYITDAAGSFKANGNLSLAGQLPRLRVEGNAEEVVYGSIAASNVSISDHSASGGNLNLEFAASGVAFGEMLADDALLQLYVDADQQTAILSVATADIQSELSLEGTPDNWNEPSTWSGIIKSFELSSDEYSAALGSPVGLNVSRTQASIDEFLIVGDHDVSLSGTASWTDTEGVIVSSVLGAVPLNLINTFVETSLTFNQSVTGQLSLRISPDGDPSGRGDITMTPGSVVGTQDPDIAFPTGEARIGFDVSGEGLQAGIIDIPLPGQGQIAAEFDVTDAGDDRPAEIDATIDVDLADIGMLVTLFPLIDDAAGALYIDLIVGGTADNPSMRGDFSLQRGALVYLPIGLVLNDIEVTSELRQDGEIELTGSFRAGDGVGHIRTRTGRAQNAANGLELTLVGENLVLVDVPDVRAVANADLHVAFDGKALNLEGEVMVPSARIRPNDLGTSKIYESKDVVIVAGELPEEPSTDDGADGIQIFGNLRASLGDDVVVDLGVAETDITGAVDLTWSGDLIPIADGRLIVDGEILAFGQRLEITEGQIRFPRGPVNDPYLRVRAEREIFGNTQVRRAGLLVAGSLKRPTIEAYTNPITTEERALTLLVTGSDFDLEQGVGSVDFGTYIAPKVFVSYGIGLFDTENVIRVRYDLKKGFGITGTSGARDSGFDLSYRFEN